MSGQPHDVPAEPNIKRSAAQDVSGGESSGLAPRADDDDPAVPSMSHDMQRFIGRQLRAVYDDVAKQPVPDRFLELMKQLDTKTSAR